RDFHVTGGQTCALPILQKINKESKSVPKNGWLCIQMVVRDGQNTVEPSIQSCTQWSIRSTKTCNHLLTSVVSPSLQLKRIRTAQQYKKRLNCLKTVKTKPALHSGGM